ncbi:MAG TPA: radical SAM protein [Smithellaceae bacterium]|nr:radical SAM protein [Smithellaceae bacterium]
MTWKRLNDFRNVCVHTGARLYSAVRGAHPASVAESKLTPRKIRSFNAPLVEHCNLRCRGCDHFAPLANPVFADLNIFERDFARLSELLDGDIERIGLMGGEPLLHPQAACFFPIARKYFPKTRIRMVSNGVLLLKQKVDFWRACADNNIIVEVTKYPLRLKYNKMKEVCAAQGVTFEFREDTGAVEKKSYHIPLDLQGRQNERKNFQKCFHANVTISLKEGRLYTCTAVPNIRHFNEFFHLNLPATDQDSIDIHKAKSAREIFEFLCQPIPFCRFCLVEKRTFGHPWRRSRKDIKEWTL